MKRLKKKELVEALTTLREANELMVVDGIAQEQLLAILVQCQETVVALGTVLESYGDAGVQMIPILEEYCEVLYQQSQCLDNIDEQKVLWRDVVTVLNVIEEKIEREIPRDKKVAVFLPYKASMWDSLESAWKAANEDKNYEVYVVPIPYYEKNPDGTFGERHYEGDLYPEYVPITPWTEYDIAKCRPDEIYIHNPYDECNYVTSVHPAYYAKKLRNYTDMLVYIPYFVAINDQVESHFCLQPGVLYSHKVVVQSEEVRQRYLEELREFEEQNKCKGQFGNLEEKIAVQQSSKLIKAKESQREDYVLPEEWKARIYKEDGSRRKILFYNTTISAMLKHGAEMLGKIERVFEEVSFHPDIVLLWRPHPLLKSTLQSMRPDLLKKYEILEQRFKQEDMGIYDESAELHRAIVWSDAYYGDSSSVVELYKETKKPIMKQNVEL